MSKTVLIFAGNPVETSPLVLKEETENIQQQLTHSPKNEQFVIKQQWATSPDEIRHALLEHQPQFVHFSAFGMGEQGIILEEETGQTKIVNADTIASFFEAATEQIQCVILNACHSALQVSTIVRHVDYVISMNLPLSDKLASQFFVIFYDALAAGKSIEFAFQIGRNALKFSDVQKPILKKRLKDKKRFWNVPLLPNPHFVGRETELQQLHETLYLRQTVALSGPSGMGKTQTVAHYAYLHRHEYQAVWWVLADTEESLNLGFMAIAQELDLPEKSFQDPQKTIASVKSWLATHKDWLLILDNADDANIIVPFLLWDLGGYQENVENNRHILLTMSETLTESFLPVVELKEMSTEEGAKLLLHCISDKTDLVKNSERIMAKTIALQLGGLPLAIKQAGAYMRETQCSFTSYLQRYHTHLLKRKETLPSSTKEHNSFHIIAATWMLAFEQIAREKQAIASILRLCVFLHPDKIPEEILVKGAKQLGDVLAPVATSPVELEMALNFLAKYSLLHYNPNTHILTIHRLGQTILREEMDEIEQRTWTKRAVRAVEKAFPFPDLENWTNCERLWLCARTCMVLLEELE